MSDLHWSDTIPDTFNRHELRVFQRAPTEVRSSRRPTDHSEGPCLLTLSFRPDSEEQRSSLASGALADLKASRGFGLDPVWHKTWTIQRELPDGTSESCVFTPDFTGSIKIANGRSRQQEASEEGDVRVTLPSAQNDTDVPWQGITPRATSLYFTPVGSGSLNVDVDNTVKFTVQAELWRDGQASDTLTPFQAKPPPTSYWGGVAFLAPSF